MPLVKIHLGMQYKYQSDRKFHKSCDRSQGDIKTKKSQALLKILSLLAAGAIISMNILLF